MNIGNSKQLDKRFYLLLFSILIFMFVLSKFNIFHFENSNIELVITQNRVNIKNINQKRVPHHRSTYYVNSLNFTKNKKYLTHKELGNTGYSQDFFVDFKSSFKLSEDKKINFIVHSDDGFNLIINNILRISFTTDRPINKNEITINLKKGTHDLKIEYYQGFGDLGIKGVYEINNKHYLIGIDSKFITFHL